MFSFLKKTFKKKKTPPDLSTHSLAEDTLETNLAKPNIEPKECVTSKAFSSYFEKQPISVTLVQGSSDSKPNNPSAQSPSTSNRSTPTYRIRNGLTEQEITRLRHVDGASKVTPIRCYPDLDQIKTLDRPSSVNPEVVTVKEGLHVNKYSEQEITRVQHVHTASKVTTNNCYPDLDQIKKKLEEMKIVERSLSVKSKVVKVKEQTIHDIAKEICFMIEPRLVNVAISKNELNQLKGDTQKKILIMHDMIENLSKFEYTFKTELDFRQKYSELEVYKKLHSFSDVKKCHRRVNDKVKRKAIKNKNSTPVFQSYRLSLRCYKGKNCDIIYYD